MSQYFLNIQLLSDTTFGRGDGVAGAIDQEVEHDIYGFPYLRGRTLKGLLREECDNLAAVLPDAHRTEWQNRVRGLFGVPGSELGTMATLHIGDARLPDDLRSAVAQQMDAQMNSSGPALLTPADILNSLTTVRKQTAINPDGVAAERSLRVSRVVLRELCLIADVQFEGEATPADQALLAAGVLALRRIGSGRNRGRGHVRCTLWHGQADCTLKYFQSFPQEAL